jgi:hypothetical protein
MQDCHSKSSIKQKGEFFTSKLDSNLRKELVKYYIWNTALHGAEIGKFGM